MKKKRQLKSKKQFLFSTKVLVIIFLCLTAFIGIGYSLLSSQLNISGTARIITGQTQYNGVGIVELTLSQTWESGGVYHYQYSGVITNTSNQKISGWEVRVGFPSGEVSTNSGSNAEFDLQDGVLICTNMSYNKNIQPGKTTSFEIQLASTNSNFKYTALSLNGINMPIPEDPNNLEDPPEPAGISVSPTSAEIYVGNTTGILAMMTPINAVGTISWTSSNTSVARVDTQGNVTAVSPGTATITASVNDYSATSSITVLSATVQSDTIAVEFSKSGGWTQGDLDIAQYTVNIENVSNSAISSWGFSVTLPTGSQVNQAWGASYTKSGNTYTFTNLSWNGSIAPGQKRTDVGIIMAISVSGYTPIATNLTAQ